MTPPTVACLLLIACSGLSQESRPALPASGSSDEALRLLAASVTGSRIVARVKDLCDLGRSPATESRASVSAATWMRGQLVAAGLADAALTAQEGERHSQGVSASIDRKEGRSSFVLAARLPDPSSRPGAHTSAAAASALVEAAMILQASRRRNQTPELPFEIRFEFGRDFAAPQGPGDAPVLAEVRFGDLGLGAKRDCLFVTVAGSDAAKAELVPKVRAILSRWKGERGFWQEFEILEDRANAGVAPRLLLSCTAPAGSVVLGPESRSSGDSCPVAGTADDTPERTVGLEPMNAVHAVRFSLLLIAHAADERRPR